MTRREKLIEARNAIIEGRERVSDRTIWQNELIWWLCKAVLMLIEKELKTKRPDPIGKEGRSYDQSGRHSVGEALLL